MRDDDLLALAHSDAPRVVLEAPAGCGKTHSVLEIARRYSARDHRSRRILVLAHTNAAVEEVRRRSKAEGLRVDASTFDALALGIVRDYSDIFGLEPGFRPGERPQDVSFDTLCELLGELLTQAPSVAAALSARYPLLICDEHQDASQPQHKLVAVLAEMGTRVRLLGDPLQAIFEDESTQAWSDTTFWASLGGELTVPRRWPDSPELGDWLLQVRSRLNGGPAAGGVPPSVRIVSVADLKDLRVNTTEPPVALTNRLLRHTLPTLAGTVALLVPSNAMARGLRVALRSEIHLDECANLQHAYDLLDRAVQAEGNPLALSHVMLDLIHATATGLQKALRDQLNDVLKDDSIDVGRKKRVLPLADLIRPIYEEPSLRSWLAVAAELSASPPAPLRMARPEAAVLLGRLRAASLDAPLDQFAELVRRRRDEPMPAASIATVHRSKGREFDHVIIPSLGAAAYSDDQRSRRLLYVALTRARRSVTIFVPAASPSKLLPLLVSA